MKQRKILAGTLAAAMIACAAPGAAVFADSNEISDMAVLAEVHTAATENELQSAVSAAAENDVITITAGFEITASIVLDKPVTVTAQDGVVLTTAIADAFVLSNGAVLDGIKMELTEKSVSQAVTMQSGSTMTGCEITGLYTLGDAEVSRAITVSPGAVGVVIENNVFTALRQPAYINNQAEVTISGNTVSGTRGFVVASGSDASITGNTFADNALDVAFVESNGQPSNYGEKMAEISAANNGCFMEDQVAKVTAKDGVFVVDSTSPNMLFENAAAVVKATDTIRFEQGEYTETITVIRPVILTSAEGVELNNLDIQSSDVTLDGLCITGVGNPGMDVAPTAIYIRANKQNIMIKNCQLNFTNITGDTTMDKRAKGIVTEPGVTGMTVENTVFNNYETAAFLNNNAQSVVFAENKVTPMNGWTQRGFKFVQTTDVEVKGNEFERGSAIEVEGACSDFTVQENAFLNTSKITFTGTEAFTGTMDLTGNYWKDGQAPSTSQVPDSIRDQVIIGSYYEEYDTESGTPSGKVEVPAVEEPVNAKITFEQVEGSNMFEVYANGVSVDGTAKVELQNLVAMELTLLVEGSTPDDNFSIVDFTPANDKLVIVPQDNEGCYLIHEYADSTTGNGQNDQTGLKILLGKITIGGYGNGSIKLASDSESWMRRRINDNIVQTGKVTGEEAAFELSEAAHTLTVNIDFNNNVAEGNTAAYQDMQVVITGTNGKKLVYDLGSGDAEDKNYVTYTAGKASLTASLTENVRYTVEVSGAGYRTAKKSIVLKDDAVLNFWNNVKDEADENGEKKNFLAGEIVADGKINVYDLSAVVSYFGEIDLNAEGTASDYVKYDLNRDGKVDSKDVAMVLVSWNE